MRTDIYFVDKYGFFKIYTLNRHRERLQRRDSTVFIALVVFSKLFYKVSLDRLVLIVFMRSWTLWFSGVNGAQE